MAPSLAWTLSPLHLQGAGEPGSLSPRQGFGDSGPARFARHELMAAGETPLEDLDEKTLVEACLANRPGAFDLIVERHRRSVYQLCYRFVGNHEDASDLSQDIFVRAWRGLQRFRGQSSLGTWLYRIGVNVCLNRVSVNRPLTESIDARPHLDEHAKDPAAELLRGE